MGISSVIDAALAVRRPIAITKSGMFRHIFDIVPNICIEYSSFKNIIEQGVSHLEELCEKWSEEKFIENYENILKDFLSY
jgi:hypothetical protein